MAENNIIWLLLVLKNIKTVQKQSKNGPKTVQKRSKNGPKWSKMVQKVKKRSKCYKIVKIGQNGPKLTLAILQKYAAVVLIWSTF